MDCPHCKHPKTRVVETIDHNDHRRRYCVCEKCGDTRRFLTIEQYAVTAFRAAGFALVPISEDGAKPFAPKKQAVFRPAGLEDIGHPIVAEAVPHLLTWWNESRWSKWKSRAVWTRNAFNQSCSRVSALAPALQVELCRAGAEEGWQKLAYEYIRTQTELPLEAPSGLRNPASAQALQEVRQWTQAG